MKKLIFATLAGMLLLTACLPARQPATPSAEQVATLVEAILTAMPTPTATEEPLIIPPTGETLPAPTITLPPEAAATAQPSPTATQQPTSTPAPTLTPPADDPRNTLGSPTWRERFRDGNNWLLGKDAYTHAGVKDGQMILTGLSTTDGWRLTWPRVKDYYLEMTVDTGECRGADQYGLFVRLPVERSDPHTGYLYAFTCNGRYSLRRWDGKTMTWLARPTAASAIQSGSNQTNRIGILLTGERMVLYANGSKLEEVTDSVFTGEGRFGMFIGAKETSNFTIYVSEVAYWENP